MLNLENTEQNSGPFFSSDFGVLLCLMTNLFYHPLTSGVTKFAWKDTITKSRLRVQHGDIAQW